MANKLLLTASALACVALTATATLPEAANPATYGAGLRSRNLTELTANPGRKAAAKAKGPSKVLAYADAGIDNVERYGELVTLLEEDFSLLATGSEEAPDLTAVLEIDPSDSKFQYPWNNMNTAYTHGEGRWGCHTAYPAGGCLYWNLDRVNPQGNLTLPISDLTANNGLFVLEFRARLQNEQDPSMPTGIIVECAETHNWAPMWDNVDDAFVTDQLTTEWRTFRLVFQGGGPSTIVNIVGQGINGGIFLDDVKLYTLKSHVAPPVLKRHSDFEEDHFNENWEAVEGADSYIVNVWSLDAEGNKEYAAENVAVAAPATTLLVENTYPDKTYYFDVVAKKGEYTSVVPLCKDIFDIAVPTLRKAVAVGDDGITFEGGVEEQEAAYGFSYMATAKRTAEEDGPFVITREDFTGWRTHLLEGDDTEYTKENPFLDGVVPGPFYPTDIKQQGWYGKNYMTYKDYLMLAPFYYTASGMASEQCCWASPQFDLSKDGGKVTVDLKLAADLWEYYDDAGNAYSRYADCAVALFNWNDEKGDYDQVDAVYITDLKFDWQNKQVVLNGASARSSIAIFGLNSYNDMFVDDIVITQNYKKGESFQDPFYYRTWQLAEDPEVVDKTTFRYTVPDYASGTEVYQRAFAGRARFDSQGQYIGYAASLWTDYDKVGSTDKYTGIGLVENDLASKVRVAAGTIYISNPEGQEVVVATVDGRCVRLGNAAELSYTPGASGIYMVKVGNSSIKIAL